MRTGEGEKERKGGERRGHTSVVIKNIFHSSGVVKRLLFRGISQECQE